MTRAERNEKRLKAFVEAERLKSQVEKIILGLERDALWPLDFEGAVLIADRALKLQTDVIALREDERK
jgi:hypothetical protein